MAAESETYEEHGSTAIEPKKVSLKWGVISMTTQFAAAVCMEAANTLAGFGMMFTQRFLYENEQTEWVATVGREIEALAEVEEE